MQFESFNQTFKRIAEGSNYKNVCFRVLHCWSLSSARNYVTGKVACHGDSVPCYVGETISLTRSAASDMGSHYFREAFNFVGPLVSELEFIHIGNLRHRNDFLIAGSTWVIHESAELELPPALAKVDRLFEMTGGGYYNCIMVELHRYSNIPLQILADGMTISIAKHDLAEGASAVFLLESQLLTSLVCHEAHNSYNFLFDR